MHGYGDLLSPVRRTACGVELWPGLDVKPLDLIVDKTRFGAFVAEVTGPSSVVHHSNFQPLMTEMGQTGTFKMSAACPLPTRSRPNRRRLDSSVSGHEQTSAKADRAFGAEMLHLKSASSNAVVMRSRRRKHSLAIANSVPYASDGHL